ncbi:LOW QUALITY PROTEIN: histone acetyltransferase type B catalytic subunit [Diretmus argenteus]
MEKKLAEYKCDTNEAICLKLVRFPEDMDDDSTTFHPEYSHQLYGDDEVAFGYKGLQIQLYYSAGNLSTLFKVKYSSKVTETFDCVEPDDVEGKIREIIPAGFSCNGDDFISLLEKEANFKPFGTLLHTYKVHNEEAGELTYQIHKVHRFPSRPGHSDVFWYHLVALAPFSFLVNSVCLWCYDVYCLWRYLPQVEMTCPGFREYHERLQTFLMWFIETASFIDVDDNRWDFFLVFEKYNKDGETLYATVGYMTVYNYYVYPDKTRPRVSQMLILPPFQGEGHGAQLLEAVHRFYCTLPKVQDITAEDPSESYVKLRDYVLVKLCQGLASFAPDKLHLGFSDDMIKEAQDKLKINKKHARRVYEILRLRATDMSDEAKARDYRLEVKKRLFGPYKKNQRELTKMMKCLRPEELVSQIRQMDTQMQHEELEKSYQDVLGEYRRIIERLATYA